MSKPIIALGIESSCDDTSAAVVNSNKEVLANIVLSQNAEHEPYQGVVPEIAARAHMNYLEHAIQQALNTASLDLNDIDIIAATGGPGLIGGVIVGTMFAKSLSFATNKPYIAINHLEGHLLAARLFHDTPYPFLTLLVSGGHAQFIAALGPSEYKILGTTLDDAPGEAFDKIAKMLNVGYPGGPIIEELAMKGNPQAFSLPLSMTNRPGCDMSFSGLKTATRQLIDKQRAIDKLSIHDIAASFQYTVTEILTRRTQNAMQKFKEITNTDHFHFVVSGGVASNNTLRDKLEALCELNKCTLSIPPIKYCTDNAAMIAWAGIENFHQGKISKLNFCPRASWSLEELSMK